MSRSPSPTPDENYIRSFESLRSELSEVPNQQTEKRTWESLLDGNLCIGEQHSDIAPKKFLIQNMDLFRRSGFSVLFMEHLSVKDDRHLLEEYYKSAPGEEMPEDLKKILKKLDEGHKFRKIAGHVLPGNRTEKYSEEWDKYNFTQIVETGKLNDIKVLPLEESMESYNYAKQGPNRYAIFSLNAKKMIDQNSEDKWLALVGSGHLNTCYGIKGICEIVSDAQDLLITDAKTIQSLEVYKVPADVAWATYNILNADGSITEACIKASMSLVRSSELDMSYGAISDDKLRADDEGLSGSSSGDVGKKEGKRPLPEGCATASEAMHKKTKEGAAANDPAPSSSVFLSGACSLQGATKKVTEDGSR